MLKRLDAFLPEMKKANDELEFRAGEGEVASFPFPKAKKLNGPDLFGGIILFLSSGLR